MLQAYIKGEEFKGEVSVPWWEVAAIATIIGLVIYLIVR
jgi:hypothetical protein